MNTKHHVGPASRAYMTAASLPVFIVMALLAGCGAGAGNGNGGNSISVSISNKATSIQAGTAVVVFLATVQNDSGNSGVTWSLTANGSACSPTCGTLSSATATAVTYTPPASGPAAPNNQPTLSATSVAKTNRSDSDTFAITPALTVSITNKFTSLNTGARAFVVNATVQNDATNSGVVWMLRANGTACSPSCGSLSGATATSVTYSPPTSVPTNQPTLTASSVHDNSKSDSDAFSINQAPISISIGNKVGTVYAGGNQIFFEANVQNDPSNSGVTWTLTANGSPCSPACGSLPNPNPGLQSVVYTSPGSVPASPNDHPTLTAADGTKSDFDSFTIGPLPPVRVTITKVSSVLAGQTGVNFSANIQYDPSSTPTVNWTLTASGSACSPACGSLSNVAATSVTYIPPASVPASPNDQPTIKATSAYDASKSDSEAFSIASTVANGCGAAGGRESSLHGHYALLVQGYTGGAADIPLALAASFVADGAGNITGGEEDINDTISPQNLTFDSTSGRSLYTVGTDNRGCLQLTNLGGTTTVFRFALGGINSGIASKGRIIEFDYNPGMGAGSRGAGILRLQDPNSFVLSALQSQYAFGVDGWGITNNQLIHFNTAGSFGNSGGTLSGMDDVNFGGITSPGTTSLTGGINSISATTGRGTGSFDFFHWAIYMVNSSEFFVIGTDPITATVSLGRAIATGNSFTASSLSGNYVVHMTGNTNGSADANLELLTMTPGGAQAGTLSGTVYSYGAGSGAQTTTLSGVTYNVDPAVGRVTLGNPGDNFPVLYLTTPTDGIAAFVVGAGADALFGMAEPHTSTALSAGIYLFGTEDPSDNTVTNKAGVETIGSGGALAGTYDQSNTSGLLSGQTASATVSLGPSGTGTAGPNTAAITSGSKLFSIDESGGTSGPAVIVVAEQ